MKFDRKNPYGAQLVDRVLLNGSGSQKSVYRLVFDAVGLEYGCGDVLALCPENGAKEVDSVLSSLHLDGNEQVAVDEIICSLRKALTRKLCITHLPKRFLDAFKTKLKNEDLENFEKNFLGEHEDQYSLCELLDNFPSVEFSAN